MKLNVAAEKVWDLDVRYAKERAPSKVQKWASAVFLKVSNSISTSHMKKKSQKWQGNGTLNVLAEMYVIFEML